MFDYWSKENRKARRERKRARGITKDTLRSDAYGKKMLSKIVKKVTMVSDEEKAKKIDSYHQKTNSYAERFKMFLESSAVGTRKNEYSSKLETTGETYEGLGDIDALLEQEDLDPITRKLIAEKMSLLTTKSKLIKGIQDKTFLANTLSTWNELIERTEGRTIGNVAPLKVVDADFEAFATVRHEQENTDVTLMRRQLDQLANDHFFMQEAFKDLLEKNHGDQKKAAKAIIKLLATAYKKVNSIGHGSKIHLSNTDNEVLGVLAMEKAHKNRKRLVRMGRILAGVSTVSTVIGTTSLAIAGISLFTPFGPVVAPIAGAISAASFGVKAISSVVQYKVGHYSLPKTDYSAHTANDVFKSQTENLNNDLLHEMGHDHDHSHEGHEHHDEHEAHHRHEGHEHHDEHVAHHSHEGHEHHDEHEVTPKQTMSRETSGGRTITKPAFLRKISGRPAHGLRRTATTTTLAEKIAKQRAQGAHIHTGCGHAH